MLHLPVALASGKMEALLNRKRKPDDRKEKQGKIHAGLAQGKNRKAQEGAATHATQPMPSSFMCSSKEEQSGEEAHFANSAQACDQVPASTHVESFIGPFNHTVVQSANLKHSLRD